MSKRIIIRSLNRSIGQARWKPTSQSLYFLFRSSSNSSTSASTKPKRFFDSNKVVKEEFKVSKNVLDTSSKLSKADANEDDLRQSVQSALEKGGIRVAGWSALERLIDAAILRDRREIRESLKSICFELGNQDQTSLPDGMQTSNSLYIQLSTASEDLVLQIVHILLSTLPEAPETLHTRLAYRYYRVGLLSYSQRLSDILEGLGKLSLKSRAIFLCTRFKFREYQDYLEALKDYRRLRDMYSKRKDDQELDRLPWFRMISDLTKVGIRDSTEAPSLPIEITLELLQDYEKYVDQKDSKAIILQSIFLDHYAKNSSRTLGPEWILHHQRIIASIHEALVERYGEDLNGNIVVFTSLIAAYGRVGLPQSAMEVWNRMITSDVGVNSIALSVIFDNCGRLNRLSDARRIFTWLEHSEQVYELMDKNVWDSWLECLCRCGSIREAMHYAFHLMQPALQKRLELVREEEQLLPSSSGESEETFKDGLSRYKPDVKTFRILLSFSRSTQNRHSYGKREPEIHAEIVRWLKRNLPDVLQHIEPHLFTLQSNSRVFDRLFHG